jgi:Tyrosine-protein kinase ephrin type A/B receptor-like
MTFQLYYSQLCILILSLIVLPAITKAAYLDVNQGIQFPIPESSFSILESGLDHVNHVAYYPLSKSYPARIIRINTQTAERIDDFVLPLNCTSFAVSVQIDVAGKYGYAVCSGGLVAQFETGSPQTTFKTLQLSPLSSGGQNADMQAISFALLDRKGEYLYTSPSRSAQNGVLQLIAIKVPELEQLSTNFLLISGVVFSNIIVSRDSSRLYACTNEPGAGIGLMEILVPEMNVTSRSCGNTGCSSQIVSCETMDIGPNDDFVYMTSQTSSTGPNAHTTLAQFNVSKSLKTFKIAFQVPIVDDQVPRTTAMAFDVLNPLGPYMYLLGGRTIVSFNLSLAATHGPLARETITVATTLPPTVYHADVGSDPSSLVVLYQGAIGPSLSQDAGVAVRYSPLGNGASSLGDPTQQTTLQTAFSSSMPGAGYVVHVDAATKQESVYTVVGMDTVSDDWALARVNPSVSIDWPGLGDGDGAVTVMPCAGNPGQFNLNGPLAAPVLIDSKGQFAYIASRTGWITRIALATGAQQGQVKLPYCHVVSKFGSITAFALGNPVLSNDDKYLVYTCSSQRDVFALDLAQFPTTNTTVPVLNPGMTTNITIPATVGSLAVHFALGAHVPSATASNKIIAIHVPHLPSDADPRSQYSVFLNIVVTIVQAPPGSLASAWTIVSQQPVRVSGFTPTILNVGYWLNGADSFVANSTAIGFTFALTTANAVTLAIDTSAWTKVSWVRTQTLTGGPLESYEYGQVASIWFDRTNMWVYCASTYFNSRKYCKYHWGMQDDPAKSSSCTTTSYIASSGFVLPSNEASTLYVGLDVQPPFVSVYDQTGCSYGEHVDGSGCTACKAGTFCDSHTCIACTQCPVNTYAPTMSRSCTPCPPGTAAPAGSPVCFELTPCPAGTYRSKDLQCIKCRPGSFSDSQNSKSCTECPKNTYAPAAGSTQCKECPSGSMSGQGSSICHSPSDNASWFSSPLGVTVLVGGSILILALLLALRVWFKRRKSNQTWQNGYGSVDGGYFQVGGSA